MQNVTDVSYSLTGLDAASADPLYRDRRDCHIKLPAAAPEQAGDREAAVGHVALSADQTRAQAQRL